ncbi:N-acetyltaurine hydrolase [Hippocampus comes]|uniref:N-acetyltaurine hydrolase n=1 Tax=Hippocampus comes TaxID=109280 RepID=A0A3Q2Z1H3_HIPCM|nr:PREDICTED: phosphotriesterase-related protein [Hippocampus comes]XP_019739372.1 PREDICTED: phosphotriesterase-related protein [Hippocampus comes]XP_019739373.1 PREDICTED: phosphotriesterase-related protein [Hippocampus comes]XP_019739374.1 PREDICTED: phosphotriesterase-related protein [Hippocampus comes]
MTELSGKVQTVLGLLDPDQLGRTMTHEHLTMTFECCYVPPPPENGQTDKNPFQLCHGHWLRQNPYSCLENLFLCQETEAVRDELLAYRKAGGGSVVENTTTGIDRDMSTLRRLAKETGVNIVAGAGYYVDCTHSDDMRKMSVEKLTDVIVGEVLYGADGTDVRCGVIGEIGTGWPITDSERKVLRAAAHAQAQLGCPVIIHPGRNVAAPAEVVRILQEAGGDICKTVMSHLDRTIFNHAELLDFAEMGSYLEYDLFGIETLNYVFNMDVDMPSDSQRINTLAFLVKEGYEDKIVIAHDIHTKDRLCKYGGHGYSHILRNIVPKMLKRGISQMQVDKILIDNPKRWLTFK